VILLDTSGLLSALFPDQRHHEACASTLRTAEPPFVVSPFVLAEIDYLITKYADVQSEIDFLNDVAAGAYLNAPFGGSDVARAVRVIERYRDLDVGLTDASIVIIAENYETTDVLTLDERHFRSLRTESGQPFRVLPADA
jgi:predicted nucleic acid-binding protein